MTKDELIAKQQLEIEELKNQVSYMKNNIIQIHNILFCIGGPLNDNYYQYTDRQLRPFRKIEKYIDWEIIENDEED